MNQMRNRHAIRKAEAELADIEDELEEVSTSYPPVTHEDLEYLHDRIDRLVTVVGKLSKKLQ